VHCSYLSRQWRHSRRHWEILNEESTLLNSIYQNVTWHFTRAAVPLAIPILEKADGKRRSFLEWKNWCLFHWSAENNSWPELLHWFVELPERRRLYPGSDFKFLQDSAPSHRAKVTQQFLRQNTPDFISADEWASYYSPSDGHITRPTLKVVTSNYIVNYFLKKRSLTTSLTTFRQK